MLFRRRIHAATRRSARAAAHLARAAAHLARAALLSLFLGGCGPRLVPFTHELRVEHNLTDKDVKNLQFYVSHRVALRRELESGSSQITSNHKLLVISGKTIEEVIIEEGTPGVAVAAQGGALAVSFERGATLTFAAAPEPGAPEPGAPEPAFPTFATPPEPFPGNAGPLAGPSIATAARAGDGFGGSYWLAALPGGEVRYQGKVFAAVDDSLRAHLLIDADSLEEVALRRTVLPGVRLPDR